MHLRCLALPLSALLVSCLGPTPAQSSAHGAAQPAASVAGAPPDVARLVPPPAVVTPSAEVPGFMRGINLGNGLDAPTEGAWGVHLSEAHFTMAQAAGLDHVRLPVRFSAHAAESAPYAIDEAFLARVDWAIDQALGHGLSVIVDMHHYEALMKDPEANADRFVALWTQIAARYQARPASVAFELANEPCDKLTPRQLNPLHARALQAVRASNPTRLVFVDSYSWAAAEFLKRLELPADPNVVASFHMYQPILLTHQTAPWMGPEFQTPGVVFPGPPSKPLRPVETARGAGWVNDWFRGYNTEPVETNPGGPKTVYDYFQTVEAYVAESHRRVYMGEFGIMDTVDSASRESWLGLVRKEAERRHIGWAYWDDGGKFRAMDVAHQRWLPNLKRALFD